MMRPVTRVGLIWASVVAAMLPVQPRVQALDRAQVQSSPLPGSVSGVVRDAATRKPIAGARVSLTGLGSAELRGTGEHPPSFQAYTAADGTFSFISVPARRYFLSARYAGYPPGQFGQESPDDPMQWFDLRSGENAKGIVLWLSPGGAISGTVRTTADQPAAGMTVRALALGATSDGRPTLKYLSQRTATDRRGEYRIADVTPGKYLIEVSSGVRPGQYAFEQILVGYSNNLDPSMVYYLDARSPIGARPIDVAPGAEVSAVDVVVPTVPKTIGVGGKITGAPFDLAGQTLRLVTTDLAVDLPPWMELAKTTVGPDGSFWFPYVPAGTYEIRGVFPPGGTVVFRPDRDYAGGPPPVLTEPPSAPPAWWCRQQVTVGTDSVADLSLRAQAGLRVRGKVMLAGDAASVDPRGLRIAARSLDGWSIDAYLAGRTLQDGTFASVALPPGRYRVEAAADDLSIQTDSAQLLGRDVTATGVDVSVGDLEGLQLTVTRAKTRVAGAVHDAAGKERTDARVVYFRVSGAWKDGLFGDGGFDVGSVRTDRLAAYDIQVAPGDYYVIALTGGLPAVWQNRKFLQSLVGLATKVSLSRGALVRQDLTVRQAPVQR